ncbi:hypothetical protein [Rheinheimera sp. MM224]|uniref:hypothetical protein n=1 Tax=Rheinheimera sp. MM224 TaxID=3019969 RepID=UPI0021F83183|nr:hypothetical protein [Rheinheimera sp. MM224]CAI3798962.1 hypothetical protein JAMGFMIE_02206 [Rheinheimera sp. MM224]
MRRILILLLLFPVSVMAQKVKTDMFTIELPDHLQIQTNKVNRVLAFGKSNSPFINIEFGQGVKEQYSQIVDRVNETIKPMGSQLSAVKCGENCEAMYAEAQTEIENTVAYSYFYLVKSKHHSFIISVASKEPILDGELQAKIIGNKILQSGI